MRRQHTYRAIGSLAGWMVATLAAAQSETTTHPPNPSDDAPDALPADVAVTVNGHPITRTAVEALFQAIARDRFQGRSFTEEELDRLRQRHWSDVVDAAVNDWLIDNAIGDATINVLDQALSDLMKMELEFHLGMSGRSREEFNDRIRGSSSLTLYDLQKLRRTTPYYRESARRERWIATKFPDKVKVTDDEVKDVYEQKWKNRELPAQVRVSHILVPPDDDSAKSKEGARQRADGILNEARKPDADFAALARKHSTCPSASAGGDLGFIHRYGDVPDGVADAAFVLELGQVSDVIDAPDGFHVIKVIDRIEPRPATLALVEDVIRTGLRNRNVRTTLREHLKELLASATIVRGDPPPAD